MTYCSNDELNDVMSRVISDIPARIGENLSPRPEAVILTGSFARGEGSVYRLDNVITVLGDIEFLVYYINATNNIRNDLQKVSEKISSDLRDNNIDCVIDLGYMSDAFFRRARSTIFAVELAECGKVIWGDKDILSTKLHSVSRKKIETMEGLYLLCNRVIEQLGSLDDVVQREGSVEKAAYAIIKLYIDMPTIILAVIGDFTAGYHARFEKLRNEYYSVGMDIFNNDRDSWERLLEDILFWINFKTTPVPLDKIYAEKYHMRMGLSFREQVLVSWIDLVPVVDKLLYWLMGVVGSKGTVRGNILLLHLNIKSIVKDWIKLLYVYYNNRNEVRVRRKYFLQKSPRQLIYAAALKLYFLNYDVIENNMKPGDGCLRTIEELLPVDFRRYCGSEKNPDYGIAVMRKKIYSIWEMYIK